MRHNYARILMSGVLVASLVMSGNTATYAQTSELDTEIPSVGAVAVVDEYIETVGTDKEILSLLPDKPAVVQKEEKNVDETKKSAEDKLFDNIAITKVSGGKEDYVNVRKRPDVNSKRVGKIYNNCGATILETTNNGWYKIVSGNCTGYIKAEFFVTGSEAKEIALNKGYVSAHVKEAVHVREKTSTESEVLTNVYKNENVTIKKFDHTGQWIKVKIDDGVGGWISADYASISIGMEHAKTNKEIREEQRRIREAEEAARRAAEEAARNNTVTQDTISNNAVDNDGGDDYSNDTDTNTNTNTNTNTSHDSEPDSSPSYGDNGSGGASDVVAYAKQFLGNPYVYGGSSLTNGTDCSGFTMSVYAHFGYSLNRVSAEQSKNGRAVSMGSLQPGDLLFYNYSGSRISHVAMYIGGGQIIHASTESTGIIISGMGSPCAARRIIG